MSNNGSNTLTRGLSVLGKLFVGSRKGPSGERVRRLKKLQKRIGVRFTDLSLLEQALTHRSYSHVTAQTRNDSNERMEFLGDSVLGLAVSQFLYLEFPDRSEGALSKMKSLLVSRKVLSSVSRTVGLGEYLLLSGEESDMGGRDRTSILADSFEGLIGAIYLDQGYRSANLFIRRTLLSDINEILKDEEHTNYKSLLQEYVQSRRLSHPVYRVRREEGPEHEKEFAVDVIVRGEPWGSGRGKSKKDAEQNAARAALEKRQEKASRPRGGSPTREPRPRRGRRGEGREDRPGRKTPPEIVEAPSSRPRGDHGVAASRERMRAKRAEEPDEGRRGETRSRRVSDRPTRERVTREPREREPREREPRGRERIPRSERAEPEAAAETRSGGEDSTRRRRRRRGSRGGAGRSSSSGSPAPEISPDAAGAAPEEMTSAGTGAETTPAAESGEFAAETRRGERRRLRDRPRREERAARAETAPEPTEVREEPREEPPAERARPEAAEPRAERERPEREPRAEHEPPAEPQPEREPQAERPGEDEAPSPARESRGRGRSPRRAPRPEPVARREPAAGERSPAPEEPAAADDTELTPAGGGDDSFARRRKRVVRGFRRR